MSTGAQRLVCKVQVRRVIETLVFLWENNVKATWMILWGGVEMYYYFVLLFIAFQLQQVRKNVRKYVKKEVRKQVRKPVGK